MKCFLSGEGIAKVFSEWGSYCGSVSRVARALWKCFPSGEVIMKVFPEWLGNCGSVSRVGRELWK